MNIEQKRQLADLSAEALERELSPQEVGWLEQLLLADAEARRYFVRRRRLQALLAGGGTVALLPSSDDRVPATGVDWDKVIAIAAEERVERIKREAEAALAKQQAEVEEERRRESWARRVGMVREKPVEVKGGWYIPYSAFYIGIAALLAVALSLGLPMLRSLMEEEPREVAEEKQSQQPEQPEPQQPVVIERPVVATLNITLDAVWAERTDANGQERHHMFYRDVNLRR